MSEIELKEHQMNKIKQIKQKHFDVEENVMSRSKQSKFVHEKLSESSQLNEEKLK